MQSFPDQNSEEVPQRHENSASAAVLSKPGNFELRSLPPPATGDAEVLVRVHGCGICASSLPVWQGRPWFNYPLEPGAPGHEGWGEIVEIGSNVREDASGLCLGQQVTFLSTNAYASYDKVSPKNVVALPPTLHDKPFPGEAIGCAMNIFRRSDIMPDQMVAIVGAGFLGLLLVQLARAAGARVIVLTRRQWARQLALRFGAEKAFDTEDWWGNTQRVVEMTAGRGCDRVIEATGLQLGLDIATEIIGEYGRLVIAGFHQDGLRSVNMQKWNWQGIDVVNAHERDPRQVIRGIRKGVSAASLGRLCLDELLTHEFSLDRLNEGFSMAVDRPEGFLKGWVRL